MSTIDPIQQGRPRPPRTPPPATSTNDPAPLHPAVPAILHAAVATGTKVFTTDADAIARALDDAGWLTTDKILRTVRAEALRDAAATTAPPCREHLIARAEAIEAGAGPAITPGSRGRHRAN